MNKVLLVLLMFLGTLFFSCKENKESSVKKNNVLKKDSIVALVEKVKIPSDIKFFLSEEQINRVKSDSSKYWEKYKKTAQIRKDSLTKLSALRSDEMIEMIKDSSRFWQINKALAIKRRNQENDRMDSIQNALRPIDSMLPFGSKPLGELIKENRNDLGFSVKRGSSLTIEEKSKRKDLYNIWKYFLKLHPNSEVYDNGGYYEQMLPTINTYEYIDDEKYKFNPINGNFVLRLSNINKYELYYSTTSSDYPSSCNPYYIKEENCCFLNEGYNCDSNGFLILYEREKKHSTVIPVFKLQNSSYGFLLRFSYVEKNTIHVFDGNSIYDWFIDEKGEVDKYRTNEDGSTTNATGYKSVRLAKTYEIEVLDNGEVKKNKITY